MGISCRGWAKGGSLKGFLDAPTPRNSDVMGPGWSLGTGSFNSSSGNSDVQPNGELNRPYPTLPIDELNRKFLASAGWWGGRTRNKTQFLLRLLYMKPYF